VAKQRVSSAPAAFENTVVVLTDGGSLAAYRVTPKAAAPAPAPAAAESAPAVPIVAPAPEPPAPTSPSPSQ
jgi:hypothetical protein